MNGMLFERQHLLLTLLDALHGPLSNTDFQKLLFLYTRECEKTATYDFVPYKFGGFSFTAYADKRRLTKAGFLVDAPAQPSLQSVCVTGSNPCVSSAQQGATVDVTITGSSNPTTNWLQGTTEASGSYARGMRIASPFLTLGALAGVVVFSATAASCHGAPSDGPRARAPGRAPAPA